MSAYRLYDYQLAIEHQLPLIVYILDISATQPGIEYNMILILHNNESFPLDLLINISNICNFSKLNILLFH